MQLDVFALEDQEYELAKVIKRHKKRVDPAIYRPGKIARMYQDLCFLADIPGVSLNFPRQPTARLEDIVAFTFETPEAYSRLLRLISEGIAQAEVARPKAVLRETIDRGSDLPEIVFTWVPLDPEIEVVTHKEPRSTYCQLWPDRKSALVDIGEHGFVLWQEVLLDETARAEVAQMINAWEQARLHDIRVENIRKSRKYDSDLARFKLRLRVIKIVALVLALLNFGVALALSQGNILVALITTIIGMFFLAGTLIDAIGDHPNCNFDYIPAE